MDLGNFGGHEVLNSFGGQTNPQTSKATFKSPVLRKICITHSFEQSVIGTQSLCHQKDSPPVSLAPKCKNCALKWSDPIVSQSLK